MESFFLWLIAMILLFRLPGYYGDEIARELKRMNDIAERAKREER